MNRELDQLVFNWNDADFPEQPLRNLAGVGVKIQDETLRDGLQSGYVNQHPSIDLMKKILIIDSSLGLNSINLGFPGSSDRQKTNVIELAKFVRVQRLDLGLTCASRAHQSDIDPIIEASMASGQAIEAGIFIRSSQIGILAEGKWELDDVLNIINNNVSYARRNGVPVMFVAEDSTRARPGDLKQIYSTAVEAGAERICIADTVGYIRPEGVSKILGFVQENIVGNNHIKIDWHGHNDLELAVANALTAYRAGAERAHGTWWGIGERAGNISMAPLLIHLRNMGASIDSSNFHHLMDYAQIAKELLSYDPAPNTPLIGSDVFNSNTGVHAAAVIAARERGVNGMAGLIYSPIDPVEIGRDYSFGIGPMSGMKNVEYVLAKLGYQVQAPLVRLILEQAKEQGRNLSDKDIQFLLENTRYFQENI